MPDQIPNSDFMTRFGAGLQGQSAPQATPAAPQDDFATRFSAGLQTQSTSGAPQKDESLLKKVGDGAVGVMSGIGGSVLDTVNSVGQLANHATKHVGLNIPEIPAEYRDNTTTSEKIGGGIENVAEFMLGDEALKGLSYAQKLAEYSKIAEVLEKYPVLEKMVHTAITQGTVGTAQGLAHGESAGQAAITGVVAGGTGGLMEGALGVAKNIAPSVMKAHGVEVPLLASDLADAGHAPEIAEKTAKAGLTGKWMMNNFLKNQGTKAEQAISAAMEDSINASGKLGNRLATDEATGIRYVNKQPLVNAEFDDMAQGFKDEAAQSGRTADPEQGRSMAKQNLDNLGEDHFKTVDEKTNGAFKTWRNKYQDTLDKLHSSSTPEDVSAARSELETLEKAPDKFGEKMNLNPHDREVVNITGQLMKRQAGFARLAEATKSAYSGIPTDVGDAVISSGRELAPAYNKINGDAFMKGLREADQTGALEDALGSEGRTNVYNLARLLQNQPKAKTAASVLEDLGNKAAKAGVLAGLAHFATAGTAAAYELGTAGLGLVLTNPKAAKALISGLKAGTSSATIGTVVASKLGLGK